MKKKAAFLALILLVIVTVALLWMRAHRSPWSPGNAAAMQEFELANQAWMKLYSTEALEHLHRAVQLDRDFVAPKIFLLVYTENKTERTRLADELRSLDLSELTPRERFLVRYHLASYDHKPDVARKVLDEYLQSHPDDPFAVELAGNQAWADQDLDRATTLYSHLLDVNPNWVTAQNRLGYTAMAQGDFTRAEQQFNTYEFVAPDQANPHDSKAELFTMTGRYKEAESELERALAIRPDFCASYGHLIDIALLKSDFDHADAIVQRSADHCSTKFVAFETCRVAAWRGQGAADIAQAWDAVPESCRKDPMGEQLILMYRLALESGHKEMARSYEEKLSKAVETYKNQRMDFGMGSAMLDYMKGEEALQEGRPEEARKLFTQADGKLLYWGSGPALFKLYNRVRLAQAEQILGDGAAARRTLDAVLKVNPKFPHPQLAGD